MTDTMLSRSRMLRIGTPRPARIATSGGVARPDKQLYLQLARLTDTLAAPALLLLVFLASNLSDLDTRFQEFLGMRVTVKNLLYVVGFAAAWRFICYQWGLYDWAHVRVRKREFLRMLGACTTGSALAVIFPAISVTGAFGIDTVLQFWVGSVVVLPLLRVGLRSLVVWSDREQRDVVIVGTGPRALRLFDDLQADREQPSRVVGFVDTNPWSPERLPDGLFLGSLADFEPLLMRSAVDEVLVALPIKSHYGEVQEALRVCERVGVRAKYLADVFEHDQAQTRFEGDGGVPVVTMLMTADDHRLLLKRAIDVAVSAVGLVVLAPLMLAIAVAVKLSSPGPVFFVQPRYGHNRRRFRMYKFRTMVDGAHQQQAQLEHLNEVSGPAFKIKNDPRLTTLGKWLRRTSLDELPQLFNVLLGQMSLVGPRPLPERDVHRFTDGALMRRFSVRPGLTCLWQVLGRSDVSFDDWIALDLQYIDSWSLAMDLKILCQTVPAVLRGRGAV
jgi:exopolysaccharide biosynthesis polyprenyl glycosylphosphotransferase